MAQAVGRTEGRTLPRGKKCFPVPQSYGNVLINRGYATNDGSEASSSDDAPFTAETAVPKYQDLLHAGAKPLLAVSQRKIGKEIIPEEDAKRLLERLRELEM